VQAWVDGELSGKEARDVAELVATSPEAGALARELSATKDFLAGNEPEATVPETREFYWSKIQRAIEREAATPTRQPVFAWLLTWRRFLAPVSGLALVAFLSLLSMNVFHQPEGEDGRHLVEVENLSEHVGSISYKSQAENIFVVYLYNKDQEPETDEEMPDDSVLQ